MEKTQIQNAKRVVRAFYEALDRAQGDEIKAAMAAHCSPNLLWRGYHPFDEITGPEAVAEAFWQPLKHALRPLQRRMDVFMAGENVYTEPGGVWVSSMGHLMGLFDAPWLGIRPTGKLAFLRYCAFHRVEGEQITETAMYFDIPHLMMQTGLQPFPPQTASHQVQPGPQTHDGVMFDPQDPERGRATLDLIDRMVTDLGTWQGALPLEEELRRTWHEDMLWWGPAGIGATYTIERYAKQHSGPFRAGFAERSKTKHICRIGEGHYGGFFGWPNFTAVPTGGFMGMPATGKPGEFRVIDIYRRDGDKLAENWIFIDLLHFWKQQGVDILGRLDQIAHSAP
jgi:ketosteroid isomerase-like protein